MNNILTPGRAGTSRMSQMVGCWLFLNSKGYSHYQDDYNLFYTSFFKDFSRPLAWHHFAADAGSGVAFKALLFFPSKL